MMNQKFLNTLICPVSKQPLIYQSDKQELWSKAAGLAFPIRDGIPIMLDSEARVLTEEERLA